jgi:hypothetical protein
MALAPSSILCRSVVIMSGSVGMGLPMTSRKDERVVATY